MKIVDLATFVGLPPGTLYHEYEPQVTGPLCIKHDSLSASDWVVETLDGMPMSDGSGDLTDHLNAMEISGTSFPLSLDYAGRNGMFPTDGLFIVYEQDDVVAMLKHIAECAGLKITLEAAV